MALKDSFAFSLVLVLSACVSGVRNNRSTLHWLRSLDPAIDCKLLPAGTAVADLEDCMNYYVCDDNHNANGPKRCKAEDGMKCFKPDANPAKSVCSDDPIICSGPEGICTKIGPQCNRACSKISDQTYDPDNCNIHYLCLEDGNSSSTLEIFCSQDMPYFNGKECVSDKAQCCSCRVPRCVQEDEGKKFADPQDCHSYYICATFGPVQLPCDDGGSFVNGQCNSNNKECTNLCDLGDVTSTTATTMTTTSTTATTTSTTETTTSTTATTMPTTTEGCTDISDFRCISPGFYARCNYCDPCYFHCEGYAVKPKIGCCTGELLFNTNPLYPYCIRPENCPYNQ